MFYKIKHLRNMFYGIISYAIQQCLRVVYPSCYNRQKKGGHGLVLNMRFLTQITCIYLI